MTPRRDWLAWTGLGLALAGIVWLAPLMLDQLVFFGDREQLSEAESARALMAVPAVLIAGCAVLLGRRVGPLVGGAVALPLVAVALAWIIPEALYQLLVYGITAPIAFGAVLAGCLPLDDAARRPLGVAAIAVIVIGSIAATPFIALLGGVTLATWWSLSGAARRGATASAID